MLSLYRDSDDSIEYEGERYTYDCNFNVVLANIDISQNDKINDLIKVRTALINYLDISKEELNDWEYQKQVGIYVAISEKVFGLKKQSEQSNKTTEDKSLYSFSEDADFIFASFMKDYNINLIEKRNRMHWNEFKALFVSLSKDTKISEVMSIRNWEPSKDDTKEYKAQMEELQKVYALNKTQLELEQVELERKKMSLMTPDERRAYANKKLKEGG